MLVASLHYKLLTDYIKRKTMQITTSQLLAVMPRAQHNVAKNKNWVINGRPLDITTATVLLNRYAEECGITTAHHWVHFLATLAVESGELRYS